MQKFSEVLDNNTHKPKKSILKIKKNGISEDYEDIGYSSMIYFSKQTQHSHTRLSLKFEEDIYLNKSHYPLDDTFKICLSDTKRKESEEMKLDSHIFCKYKKSTQYFPSKKLPNLNSPNELSLNQCKLNFGNTIEEENDDDGVLECTPKMKSCIFGVKENIYPAIIRKSSSIMEKLELHQRKSSNLLTKVKSSCYEN